MLPLKRTTSERGDFDNSSLNSLNVADSFYTKHKTPDRLPPKAMLRTRIDFVNKMPSFTSLSTQPSISFGDFNVPRPVSLLSGVKSSKPLAVNLKFPPVLAIQHKTVPHRAYCIPDFSRVISKELIEMSIKNLLIRSAF